MWAGMSSGPSPSCYVGWIAVGRQLGGELFQIAADGRIGVLADDERCARVVDEDVTEPLVDLRPLDDLLDLPRELVGSTAAGLDRQMLSVDH